MLQSVVSVITVFFVKESFATGSPYEHCAVSHTIIAPYGDVAVFNLKTNVSLLGFIFRQRTRDIARVIFVKRPKIKHPHEKKYRFETSYMDNSIRLRSNVTAINPTEETSTISILISDLRLSDNGTYDAKDIYAGIITCWTLFVLDLRQSPSGYINENEGVRILAEPAASILKDPVRKATEVWLLDGEYLNQTGYFLIQDGGIWTSRIPRALNGRNVTYRAIQYDGTLSEINLTLNVAYGPDLPVALRPSKTFYTLQKGEEMPNVECKADCNPPCMVAWEGSSSTDVLRLGTASTSMSGEYTCTARSQQNGTSRIVKTSIFVMVADHTMAITLFSVLGSTQVCSLLLIGVLFVCRRSKYPLCSKCGTACQKHCQQKEDMKRRSATVSTIELNQTPPCHSRLRGNVAYRHDRSEYWGNMNGYCYFAGKL